MRLNNIIGAPKLKMGTFCSGIGAPEVAARGMFEPIWFSEIEPFPCAVLDHHWPNVPNLGDMTAPDLVERIASAGLPDAVVAGLPCQPFSVAGLRKGEADPRNLTSRFVEIADAVDDLRRNAGKPPVWWLVENVPGLLNDRGNAFGALLGGMVGSASAIVPDGRWESAGVATGPRRSAAWRVLDAQFHGLAQRRKRVFALFVSDAGSLACADALLPVIDSMSWHSPPRREAGQGSSAGAAQGVALRGRDGGATAELTGPVSTALRCGGGGGDKPHALIASTGDVAHCLNAGGMGRQDDETETKVAHTLKGGGFDASEDGTGRGTPLVPAVAGTMKACKESGGWSNSADHAAAGYMVPVAFTAKDYGGDAVENVSPTLRAGGHTGSHANAGVMPAVAFDLNQITSKVNRSRPDPAVHHTLPATACPPHLATEWAVRRLTPIETARLQGFPDDHTAITYRGKPAADGPQYKAHGNSMAVPVVRWIMERMRISMEDNA